MHSSKDTQFISSLYVKYSSDVRNFLRARYRCDDQLDDIVQETFLKAHRSACWENIKNPKAYLMRTAKNLFIDLMRKKSRNLVDYSDTIEDEHSDINNPARTQLADEEMYLLSVAIEQLTQQVKTAFVLRKVYDLSYIEIAARMNLSVRTIEKHVANGLAKVAVSMRKQKAAKNTNNTTHKTKALALVQNRQKL